MYMHLHTETNLLSYHEALRNTQKTCIPACMCDLYIQCSHYILICIHFIGLQAWLVCPKFIQSQKQDLFAPIDPSPAQ